MEFGSFLIEAAVGIARLRWTLNSVLPPLFVFEGSSWRGLKMMFDQFVFFAQSFSVTKSREGCAADSRMVRNLRDSHVGRG